MSKETTFIERPPVTIYLVRHGQSAANVDKNVYRLSPDHTIELTAHGLQQAHEAGEFLHQELAASDSRAMLLRSPFIRTRQTEAALYRKIKDQIDERVELVEMAEQQLGVFNGIPDDERATTFPHEYARFKLQNDFSGAFWARPPQGESPYDVYNRASTVTAHVRSAHRRLGTSTFILVSHAYWIQCFVMNWCNLPFEWFSANRYLSNAEVLKIEGHDVIGKVFTPARPTTENPHAPANPEPQQGEPHEVHA